MTKDDELIKLGIAMDYPVNWDFEMIVRDLVQNFYDAAGREHFYKEVSYLLKEEEEGLSLCIESEEHDFGYEWLVYIGASTKTGIRNRYVGQYGEGFKFAVLCLVKRYQMEIIMESREWRLVPCIYEEEIGGRMQRMLGYRRTIRRDDGHTRLLLQGIERHFRWVLEEALLHFDYPENPLFGKEICRNDQTAIYERSEMDIPSRDGDRNFKGVLYYNFLARARLPFSMIVCVNGGDDYEEWDGRDSRDRNPFSKETTVRILTKESIHFSPEASFEMLCRMESEWNKLPQELYDFGTWYYLICSLVRNIASDEVQKKRFQNGYRDLVYIERPSPDRSQKKLVSQTQKWWRLNRETRKRQVIPVFRLLGAESLTDWYLEEQNSCFVVPTKTELDRFRLVMEAACACERMELDDGFPELLIDESGKNNYQPELFSKPTYGGRGKPKYKIEKIVMKHSDFEDGSFKRTYVKAVDLLFHRFGTSRSAAVNAMLTRAGTHIMDNREYLMEVRKKWTQLRG